MMLSKLAGIEASSEEEVFAAARFLQNLPESSEHITDSLQALQRFLTELDPASAREVAIEVLLAC